MAEFKLPPISPLAGTTITNFLRVLKKGRIEPRHWFKVFLTGLIILIGTPFRWYEKIRFRAKIKNFTFDEDPIFIIGHWRSGTTLLHNLMCQDPDSGYLTTYQSLFPHNLGSKWLFKTFMRLVMPERRPGDNIKLSVDFPQEEEFTLSNLHPFSYYDFFYFPKDHNRFFDRFIKYEGLTEDERETWKKKYKELITKALINKGGRRAIFKNPVCTGRVKIILETFPNAKFIYLYRNPVIVFLSSKKFFTPLIPTLFYHKFSPEQTSRMVMDIYPKLFQEYFSQKHLIPSQNLMEIRFEDFEKDPIGYIKDVYSQFNMPGIEQAEPYFTKYLDDQKSHRKNRYSISRDELGAITHEWKEAFTTWNYEVPDNIEVDL